MANNSFWPNFEKSSLNYTDSNLRRQDYEAVSTPEWIISADDIFSQDNADSNYQKFSRCHSVETFLNHDIRNNVNGNFTSSGHIIAGDTIVVMPVGPYIATLKNALGNATKIESIVAIRLSVVNSVLTPLQTITFTTCYITDVHQLNNNLEFHFRFIKSDDEYAVIKQDGSTSGSKTATIDLNQFKVS